MASWKTIDLKPRAGTSANLQRQPRAISTAWPSYEGNAGRRLPAGNKFPRPLGRAQHPNLTKRPSSIWAEKRSSSLPRLYTRTPHPPLALFPGTAPPYYGNQTALISFRTATAVNWKERPKASSKPFRLRCQSLRTLRRPPISLDNPRPPTGGSSIPKLSTAPPSPGEKKNSHLTAATPKNYSPTGNSEHR